MIPFLIFAAIFAGAAIFGITVSRRITFPNAFTQDRISFPDRDDRDRGAWNYAGPGGVLIVVLVVLAILWLLGIRFGVNT